MVDVDFEISKGLNLFRQKKYSEAAQLFENISNILKENDSILKSAEISNNASVAYLLNGNAQKAFEMAKDTHFIFENENDWKNSGLALGNQAAALEELGDKKKAFDLYQLAAENLKKAGEMESRAYILKRISSLQMQKGEQFEALGSMSAALQQLPKLSRKEKFIKKLTEIIFKIGN